MSSSRHDRVSQLFLEAIGLPPGDRRAFLDEHCAGDAELIREVEDLIARDTRPAAVDTPVLDRAVAESAMGEPTRANELPKKIARYEIVDVLGRGGMGVVYRARQTNPSRDVALKVVHPFVTSATLSRRVEFEAQVLGRLQHPGIAQIFEAGSDNLDSRPLSFFAMELIEGLPIDKFVRKNGLSTRDRLKLLIKVCDAVHHAHQKGVIHRDLKPANILVTNSGQPKILDFGIARVTDADIHTTTLKTNVGQLLGTIAYMSPEQVTGNPDDIDTRSDVYALGVLGYQLLTGNLPYDLDNKSVPDAARIIRDIDPTMLGTLDRDFRGDIEIIISKALEKDKDRRYASVAEFAADLHRHLSSEPIAARRPSMMYQLGKFAHRNKALVGGVTAVFVLLIASVCVISYFYFKARNERDAAIQARTELRDANVALEDETAKLETVNHFLGRMIESANPLSEIGYASKDITVLEMIDRETANIDKAFKDRPTMEAALRTTFGSINAGLGRYEEAEKQYRLALDLHWKTGGDDKDTARAIRDFASILARKGEIEEAINWFRKALAINLKTSGEDSFDTAMTECRLAYAFLQANRIDEAEPLAVSAVDKFRRHADQDKIDNLYRAITILGKVYSSRGKYDEAQKLYREALAGFRECYGETHAAIASGVNSVAQMCLRKGDMEGAEAGYKEAIEIIRKVAGNDHPMLGTFLNNLAYVQDSRSEYDESIETYRESLRIIEKSYGRNHREYISTLYNIAFPLYSSGRIQESMEAYKTVADYRKEHLGPDNERTLAPELYWATCKAELGEPDVAEPVMRRILETFRKTRPIDDVYTQKTLSVLIEFYDKHGKSDEADKLRPLLTKK
ncbi:MAG: serine/threonine protein kinase [Phycisphaerales bacterium]|nr:serine/threonine protein kinase [Phycisphaerales bacterium]MCB9857664.1 serine/threonine protein kinase [Phycisphaerales bacterium]